MGFVARMEDTYRLPKYVCMYLCIYVRSSHLARVWINRVSKVASPARGQLNREN